jgi:hypothetical protein
MRLTTHFCVVGESITTAVKEVMELTFPESEAVF